MAAPQARALAGWKRTNAKHGIVLTLQLAQDVEHFREQDFERLNVALDDRQLRSLARDLARAAEGRGIELYTKRRWWRFWRRKRD